MPAWTCPFCSLLCDGFALVDAAPPHLTGSDCPRAHAALASHAEAAPAVRARVDGQAATPEAALAAAAGRLAGWRQPLFGGLGTDIAGARALARLAGRVGAICDHADGEAQMHGLRALQDRGQYQATFGEVRKRADLIVCVGTTAVERHPEFFRRVGVGEPGRPCGGRVPRRAGARALSAREFPRSRCPAPGTCSPTCSSSPRWCRAAAPARWTPASPRCAGGCARRAMRCWCGRPARCRRTAR